MVRLYANLVYKNQVEQQNGINGFKQNLMALFIAISKRNLHFKYL